MTKKSYLPADENLDRVEVWLVETTLDRESQVNGVFSSKRCAQQAAKWVRAQYENRDHCPLQSVTVGGPFFLDAEVLPTQLMPVWDQEVRAMARAEMERRGYT